MAQPWLRMKLLRPTPKITNAMRGCLLGLSLFGLAGGALAQTRELSSSGVLLDRIAAVVNDGVVLNSQLEEQTEEITARLRQQNTELPPRNVLPKPYAIDGLLAALQQAADANTVSGPAPAASD